MLAQWKGNVSAPCFWPHSGRQALCPKHPKRTARSKRLGRNCCFSVRRTAWRWASWSLAFRHGSPGNRLWDLRAEGLLGSALWNGIMRRDEGCKTKTSANPPGHSDIRMAFWIISPWGKGDQNFKLSYLPVTGCKMPGDGGRDMTLMTWEQWLSWELSAVKSWRDECVSLRREGSGWHTT